MRLKSHGLEFHSAFTNTAMCSPARATLFSGFLPAQHHVRYTLEEQMPNTTYPQMELPTPNTIPNLATVALAAGFKSVVYKGKMHFSKPLDPGYKWTVEDALKYGWQRWNPPDAGANQDPSQAGGSPAYNDDRIMYQIGNASEGTEGALQYLSTYAKFMQPFFLVVSLVNPHDVLLYPKGINSTNYTSSMFQGSIGLPPTLYEDLKSKPTVQRSFRNIINLGLGPLSTDAMKLKYVNFYGNLMKAADAKLLDLLNMLDSTGLTDSTVVIRTSDHGEMGLAHGGLRQKNFNIYEESIRIRLLYSNPVLFPKAQSTNALVSHVDFVPTIASLFGATLPGNSTPCNWAGVDYSSILLNASRPHDVQTYIPFTYDDFQSGQSHGPYPVEPNHIIGLREKRYKFAKYYAPLGSRSSRKSEFEMYDLQVDPLERVNLAASGYNRTATQEYEYKRLQRKLAEMIKSRLNPIPISQPVQFIASTKNVRRKASVFEDRGQVTGFPLGTGNIRLVYKLNQRQKTATNNFLILSKTGSIGGKANMTFTINATHIYFVGTCSFDHGTGGYRGISATGLSFTDTNTLSGQHGQVTIDGLASF
jgi:choline-sulfatase